MSKSTTVTNVTRLLDKNKIPYTPHQYPHAKDDPVDGMWVANLVGRDPGQLFKTLVTLGASKANYVFVIPVPEELDLKKAAKAVGEKSLALLPLKLLTPLTGYVRGGCSPIGMKKRLVTTLDQAGLGRETILISAGKIGTQVEIAPQALADFIGATFADLTITQEEHQ